MKRTLSVLLAGLLVFAFAGQAAAFFEDLHLIRSIYTTAGTVEVGTDLGLDVSTFSLASPVNGQRNPDVNLSLLDGALSSLVVGYWAHNNVPAPGSAARDFYATGNYEDGDGLTMLGRKQSTADATYNGVQALYADGGPTTSVLKTNLNSYTTKFDVNGDNIGSMGSNLRNDSNEMTLSLAALATAGYVDQYLYYFDYNAAGGDTAGVAVAVIRTFLTSDGDTIDLSGNMIATLINPSAPSAVPVPAAVWLLGTGIVGLVGIRRRKS